jgi:hypothetical protein
MAWHHLAAISISSEISAKAEVASAAKQQKQRSS